MFLKDDEVKTLVTFPDCREFGIPNQQFFGDIL